MSGRNSIVKSAEIVSEHNAKKLPENFLPHQEILKADMISLNYDVCAGLSSDSSFHAPTQSDSPSSAMHWEGIWACAVGAPVR